MIILSGTFRLDTSTTSSFAFTAASWLVRTDQQKSWDFSWAFAPDSWAFDPFCSVLSQIGYSARHSILCWKLLEYLDLCVLFLATPAEVPVAHNVNGLSRQTAHECVLEHKRHFPTLSNSGVQGPPIYDEKSPPRGNIGRALKSLSNDLIAQSKKHGNKACQACGTQFFPRTNAQKYCRECRLPSPAVYRFINPKGMSYVGSTRYSKTRSVGLDRSNDRIRDAVEQFPPETWTEILDELPPECSDQELRAAEQKWINKLGTLDPDRGYNVEFALHDGWQSPFKTARDYDVSPHFLKKWEKLLGFPKPIAAVNGRLFTASPTWTIGTASGRGSRVMRSHAKPRTKPKSGKLLPNKKRPPPEIQKASRLPREASVLTAGSRKPVTQE